MLLVLTVFLAVTLGILALNSLVEMFWQRRSGLRQWVEKEMSKRQSERARKSLLLLKREALPDAPGAKIASGQRRI